MIDALNAMRSAGYQIDHLIFDTKVHRFGGKGKPDWYVGFQNHTRGGDICLIVQFGSWRTGDVQTWHSTDVELKADDKAFIQKKIKEAQRKEREEKEINQNEVADKCAAFWETLGAVEIPPYAQRKQMRELFGARSLNSDLYVPTRDVDGKIWGLQRITSDGSKFFSPGQRVTGTLHSIGDFSKPETICIAEGFATGASIYAAVERPVVIAFNAGNLSAVSEEIRRKYPESKIIICADNDAWTTKKVKKEDGDFKEIAWNPGIESAEKAALKIGASVVVPKFESIETKPTDFNDLHLLEGLEAVSAQIAPVKAQRHFVVPLGFREKEYFFTTSSNEQIVSIKSFSDSEFFNLMPLEYWEQAFPGIKGGANFTKAKSDLMEICRAKGVFESRHVRGSGVWLDDGRVVVNMGDHLLVDGNRIEVSEIKSRYFYTIGKALPELSQSPLELSECELLSDITENFRWQRPEFGPLMAGAIVISKLCGALPVRPHVWLTGGSQTGKSTLLEKLIYPTLHGFNLYFLGGTSEAGVRQSLGSDSVPVMFDEFETNGPKSSEMIQSCIELMRASWSESNGVIAKGSSGGNAMFYQPRFSAIVSSIRTNLVNDADRSRFTVIELAPHGSDPVHWAKLNGMLSQYDATYANRLFARTLRQLPTILASYEVLRKALGQKVGARFGQQYGMLLAGYWSLKSDDSISMQEAKGLLASFDFAEEQDESRMTDELELVSFLATTSLRVSNSEERTIAALLGREKNSNPMALDVDTSGVLGRKGFAIVGDHVAIASNHSGLRDLLRNTKWANCWPKTLARLPGALKNVPQRFDGKTLKATRIPLSLFT